MEVRELRLEPKAAMAEVLDQVVRIERRVFPKHESMASTLHQEATKKNAGLLYVTAPPPPAQQEKHHHHLLLLDHPLEVAGYVMYCFTSSVAASITKLAVCEKYRRQGYGEALLKAAIDTCCRRRLSRITLHVDPDREAAMALYKKMDFKLDAVITSYYAPHRDAHRLYIDFDKY